MMKRRSVGVGTLCLSALFLQTMTYAATTRVVATGDSLTDGISRPGYIEPGRLQFAFDAAGQDVHVTTIARGGISMRHYVGRDVISPTEGTRDFAGEVLAADPDVILFMMGTNDTKYWCWHPVYGFHAHEQALAAYAGDVIDTFDRFASFVNTNGRRPKVIVSTPIPIMVQVNGQPVPDPAVAAILEEKNQALIEDIGPFLRDEVASRDDFYLLDSWTNIQQQPNWSDWYSDNYHLWAAGQAGYDWFADQYVSKTQDVLNVPEPATLSLLALSALAVIRRRKRHA